jgi:hypothetical protein
MSDGVLSRMRPDLSIGAALARRAATSGWRQPGSLARTRRLGDNAGMARDDSKDLSWLRLAFMPLLNGPGPRGRSGWVSPVALVVIQAAAGAGHWAAGRRQRALAEWAGAAGFGLVAWGLGTEAPTMAEVQETMRRQQRDLLRKLGTEAPATAGTETPMARRLSRYFRSVRSDLVSSVVWVVIGGPWRLRHPRRLTVLAIAAEAEPTAFNVLRAARAVQRRRPRMAVGSALVAAGSVARLRAAADPSGNSRPAAATAITGDRETAEGTRRARDYPGTDVQAGGGQAAVDQGGAVLDLVELALDDADQAHRRKASAPPPRGTRRTTRRPLALLR